MSRPSVRSFLLDGKDPRIRDADQEAHWGLARLEGYGAAFLLVSLKACGLPLAGSDAYVLLLREDCGGAEAAQAAAQLVNGVLESGLPGHLAPRSSSSLGLSKRSSIDPRSVDDMN